MECGGWGLGILKGLREDVRSCPFKSIEVADLRGYRLHAITDRLECVVLSQTEAPSDDHAQRCMSLGQLIGSSIDICRCHSSRLVSAYSHIVKSENTLREMSNQLDFDICNELVSQRHMRYHICLPRQPCDYCQWIPRAS